MERKSWTSCNLNVILQQSCAAILKVNNITYISAHNGEFLDMFETGNTTDLPWKQAHMVQPTL